MAQKTVHPLAEPIILKGLGEEVFLLIHGYTGSPTDFNGLPEFLHKQHNASVFIPLLPGHGTRVEDLRGVTKDDFMQVAEAVLQDLLAKHSRVIVGGHSFGGQVALHLAARYPVSGVFVSAMPYKLRFTKLIVLLFSSEDIFLPNPKAFPIKNKPLHKTIIDIKTINQKRLLVNIILQFPIKFLFINGSIHQSRKVQKSKVLKLGTYVFVFYFKAPRTFPISDCFGPKYTSCTSNL